MKFPAKQAWLAGRVAFAAVFAASCLTSLAQDVPHNYLRPGQPEIAVLPPPPLSGSAEDAADMAQVVAVHKSSPSNEVAVALSESKFSVFTFTPAVGAFFQQEKLPRTAAFFERVQKDAAAATSEAKNFWKRPRPYTVDPSLATGKLEKSFSYPSGHSTEATVLALVLADLFPDKKNEILAVGRNIGWHRVEIARHYPTDIYAGRVYGLAIVRELKASPDYRRDFTAAQMEIADAVQSRNKPAATTLTPAAPH